MSSHFFNNSKKSYIFTGKINLIFKITLHIYIKIQLIYSFKNSTSQLSGHKICIPQDLIVKMN